MNTVQPPASPPQVRATPTSGLAITSLIAGIVSFLLPILSSLIAIVCGHMAHSSIKKSNGSIQGKGMALAGVICGYLTLVFGLLTVAIVLFFVKEVKQDRKNHQTAVIEDTAHAFQIHGLLLKYEKDHGKFPATLQELEDKGYCASIKALQTHRGEHWTYYHSQSSQSDPDNLLLWSDHTDVILYVNGTTDRASSYADHMNALQHMSGHDKIIE